MPVGSRWCCRTISDPEQTLDALDGLVLSGGGDLDPRSYRERNAGASKDVDAEADAWEIALVRAAEARGLPVLGICRGMQIMAVASGGRLDQDIAGCEGHPDMRAMTADAVLGARHAVTLDPASTLGSIYGVPTRQVNTIHHQAVSDAGALRVAARGAGGLVEALEAPGGWAAVGVQWHPEKATRDEARAEGLLFGHLVDRARAFRRSKQEHGR